MKIITRYLVNEFLQVYVVSIIALSGLYVIVNIFESLKDIVARHPPVGVIGLFYATQIPGIVYQTVPMAALLAVVIVYTVMSRDNEIGSLLSAGISPFTIARPLVVLVAVLSLFHFVLGEYVVPRANVRNDRLDARIRHAASSLSRGFKVNNIWYKSGDDIYRVGLFIPWLNTLKDVTVYSFSKDDGALIERRDIDTARWGHGGWYEKSLYTRDFKDGEQTSYTFRRNATVQLPFDISDFRHTGKTSDEMDYAELKSYIRKLKHEGYAYAPYDVDLNEKVAYPLSSLFVVLLVIPFSLKKRKTSGMMLALGVSLAIGFSYWIIMALSMSMGNSGLLGSAAAAWLPNAVTLIAAAVVIRFTRW